jgi:hypothetical protein
MGALNDYVSTLPRLERGGCSFFAIETGKQDLFFSSFIGRALSPRLLSHVQSKMTDPLWFKDQQIVGDGILYFWHEGMFYFNEWIVVIVLPFLEPEMAIYIASIGHRQIKKNLDLLPQLSLFEKEGEVRKEKEQPAGEEQVETFLKKVKERISDIHPFSPTGNLSNLIKNLRDWGQDFTLPMIWDPLVKRGLLKAMRNLAGNSIFYYYKVTDKGLKYFDNNYSSKKYPDTTFPLLKKGSLSLVMRLWKDIGLISEECVVYDGSILYSVLNNETGELVSGPLSDCRKAVELCLDCNRLAKSKIYKLVVDVTDCNDDILSAKIIEP